MCSSLLGLDTYNNVEMRTAIFLVTICLFFASGFLAPVSAVYDPLSVPNNRIGVHILDPSEIELAAKFINSSSGEWGYVTVPMRADDRDRSKWTQFFRKANELKVVPIVRIATYAEDGTWKIPTDGEILYFANFLDEMPWPTRNRYIVVFNEPNHSNEWGGELSPEEYAEKLAYTIEVFKQRHEDFFMLPAAMDRAAPQNHTSYSADFYWKKVFEHKPELVNQIDGWNAHAYPNPGFSGRPSDTHSKSVVSYRHELQMLRRLGRTNIPVFITETGWSMENLTEAQIARFWESTLAEIWDDTEIAAVNIWLLQAHEGPFAQFSMIKRDGSPSLMYESIAQIPKIQGTPQLAVLPTPPILPTPTSAPLVAYKALASGGPVFDLGVWWRQAVQLFSRPKSSATPQSEEKILLVDGHEVKIEIADESPEQTLGLGHRTHLDEDRGMLFIYPEPAYYGFWMKHTLIPLDMIWVEEGRIVDIAHNVPVEADPVNPQTTYRPQKPASWILEVNGGWAERNGVQVSDHVELLSR